MSDVLLTTKLYMPPARPDLVPRPRLTGRLSAALARPLTLIAAPAGFGKTTLLGEWRTTPAGRGFPLAWLSLDADDNDPHRFWTYVAAALRTLPAFAGAAHLAAASLEMLRTAPALPPRHWLPPLLNDLAAAGRPFALVLDDYHVIAAPAVHSAVQFLIDHLPPQMHLVLLTRADPPWSLARLRAQGRLAEFRAADLRFTDGEAAALLGRTLPDGLAADDVLRLQQRTEGWAAALQMAALSLAGQADHHGFVTAFAGEHRFIADYLAEEVISHLPEPLQDFLLSTSILERMTAPLCAALTDRDDAGDVLAQIERSGLFLIPLDDQRRWFRYHHLFADLLRARLRRLRPAAVAELYRRASEWHEAAGDAFTAVTYALAGADHDRAGRLVEQHVHGWWGLASGDFVRLLARLPEAVVRSRPTLAVYQAWFAIITGRVGAAAALLDAAGAPASEALRSFVALMRAYVAELTGRPYTLSPQVTAAPGQIPETNVAMRNSADVVLAFILYMNGDLAGAADLLTAAAHRDTAANLTEAGPITISRLARIRLLQGRLPEAAALCRSHLAQIAADGAGRHFVNGNLHTALADLLREQNDLEGAAAQAAEAIAQNELWQIPDSLASAYLLQARIMLARTDAGGAAEALARAEACSRGRTLATDLVQLQTAVQVRIWLLSGNLTAARQWADQHRPGAAAPTTFRQEVVRLALARILLAEDRGPEAEALLAPMAAAAAEGQRTGRLIEILALQALALRRHDPERAAAILEQALLLAEPAGYVRTFLDEGQPMTELLRELAGRRGTAQAYAARLLAACTPAPAATAPNEGLPEPLTDRELEVLRLLAAGLSNQELAQRLVVTYGTVKTHVHNIYGKLGADSRVRAIARARELGLI